MSCAAAQHPQHHAALYLPPTLGRSPRPRAAQVIKTSVNALLPGGTFYLGDVRANTLFPHFHASVQLYQAPDDLAADELRSKVRAALLCAKCGCLG